MGPSHPTQESFHASSRCHHRHRLGRVKKEELRKAAVLFVVHHAELDKVHGRRGRHHPKQYDNASYYWHFGYAWAAEMARALGKDGRELKKVIRAQILKRRKKDGSWNDCPDLGPSYGTAMALLALAD